MKNGLLFLVVGLMIISCASFKATYEDDVIFAELVVDDATWVVLNIKNNSAEQINLLVDKAYYSNTGTAENTLLVPLNANTSPGQKLVPIPIPAGRTVIQKFAAPGYIKYKRGKVGSIKKWTPNDEKYIRSASFDFEYQGEQEGEASKRFFFAGPDFISLK